MGKFAHFDQSAMIIVSFRGWFSQQKYETDAYESNDYLDLYSRINIQVHVKQAIFKLHVTDLSFSKKRNYNALGTYNYSAKVMKRKATSTDTHKNHFTICLPQYYVEFT